MTLIKNFSKKHIIYISLVFIISTILKFLWIFKVPCIPISDFEVYHKIATNIHTLGTHSYLGKPIAFQGMGYPYILGIWYSIFNTNSILSAKILNVILSSLSLIFILGILLKILNNKRNVLIGFTIIALLPNYIGYTNVLGTEHLSLLLFSIIIFLHISNINKHLKYISLGLFIGLASLTKPYFMAYPLVIALIEYYKIKNIKQTIIMFLSIFIITMLTIAPWTYRNYKIYGKVIPISYNGGYVLFINNNDNNTTGSWMSISNIKLSKSLEDKLDKQKFDYKTSVKNEVTDVSLNPNINYILKDEAKQWIKSHPIDFIKLGFKRIKNTFFKGAGDVFMWCSNNNDFNFYILKKLSDFIINIITISSFIYIIIKLKSLFIRLFKNKLNYKTTLPIINILFFTAIPFVFEGQSRYNFLVLFLFIICFIKMCTYINTYFVTKFDT